MEIWKGGAAADKITINRRTVILDVVTNCFPNPVILCIKVPSTYIYDYLCVYLNLYTIINKYIYIYIFTLCIHTFAVWMMQVTQVADTWSNIHIQLQVYECIHLQCTKHTYIHTYTYTHTYVRTYIQTDRDRQTDRHTQRQTFIDCILDT